MPIQSITLRAALAIALFVMAIRTSAALVVTQPTASTVVSAGDDYATQVLGDAWNMNEAIDVDMQESFNVTNQVFGGSLFSGITTAADANVYPLFEGQLSSINLSRGANFPVDTSHYRYLTVKSKATQPGAATEFSRVIFYKENGTFGFGVYHALVPANSFVIFTNDMNTQIDGTSPHQWSDFPQVSGLRIDPATPGGAFTTGSQFSIDWIRLTASATFGQLTPVAWTDSGYNGSYDLTAIDSDGTSYQLASGVSGTGYSADLTFLEPGNYSITVTRSNHSASANSATFSINAPPQIVITSPNVRGDLSRDFAATVVGNAWGPFNAGDFQTVSNFKNVSYNNPVNSFYGRPTNSDPGWSFNLGGHSIDTNIYRALCIKQMVFGQRNVGTGGVARVFWGNGASALTTSDDIVLDDNAGDTVVSTYCIPDLAETSIIDPTAPHNGGTWSGTKSVFRIDPDEFTPPNGCNTADNCHDVRLDSVTLSPFAQANPGFTFHWTLADADDASSTLDLYLDPDRDPSNGNEILIHTTNASSGSGTYAWPGSSSVDYGTYNVLITADDGHNSVSQYAGGPLVVGAYDGIFRNGFDALP